MFVNGEFSVGWDHWSDLGGDLEKATSCLLMVPKKQAHLKQHVAVIWSSFGDDFPVEYRCFPLRYPWSKRHTDNHVLPKPSLNLTLCPDFHHLDTKWSRLILQLWLVKGENSFLSSRIFLGVFIQVLESSLKLLLLPLGDENCAPNARLLGFNPYLSFGTRTRPDSPYWQVYDL